MPKEILDTEDYLTEDFIVCPNGNDATLSDNERELRHQLDKEKLLEELGGNIRKITAEDLNTRVRSSDSIGVQDFDDEECETVPYGPNWNMLKNMSEKELRREVTAARQVEIDIQGNDPELPSVDELMKRYIP